MPRREYLADFADGNVFGTSFLTRVDSVSRSYLQALAPGPVELNDPTEGMIHKGWYLRIDNAGGKGYIVESKPNVSQGWMEEVELFTFTGDPIVEMDFCFDQNGAPFMAAERSDGHLWIRYFKPSAGEFVFEDFGVGTNPKCILDDPVNIVDSDILVFYKRSGGLRIREQSDLYVGEINPGIVLSSEQFIEGCLRDRQHRVHIVISTRNAGLGTWALTRETSELYPIYLPDEGLAVNHRALSGDVVTKVLLYSTPAEGVDVGNRAVAGAVAFVTWAEDVLDEADYAASVLSVDVTEVVIRYEATQEGMDAQNRSIAGTIVAVVIEYEAPDEGVDVANASISGTITTP